VCGWQAGSFGQPGLEARIKESPPAFRSARRSADCERSSLAITRLVTFPARSNSVPAKTYAAGGPANTRQKVNPVTNMVATRGAAGCALGKHQSYPSIIEFQWRPALVLTFGPPLMCVKTAVLAGVQPGRDLRSCLKRPRLGRNEKTPACTAKPRASPARGFACRLVRTMCRKHRPRS
jgi:hypothetical protein